MPRKRIIEKNIPVPDGSPQSAAEISKWTDRLADNCYRYWHLFDYFVAIGSKKSEEILNEVRQQKEGTYLVQGILFPAKCVADAAEDAWKQFWKAQLSTEKSKSHLDNVGPANPATSTPAQSKGSNTKIVAPQFASVQSLDSEKLVKSSDRTVSTTDQKHSTPPVSKNTKIKNIYLTSIPETNVPLPDGSPQSSAEISKWRERLVPADCCLRRMHLANYFVAIGSKKAEKVLNQVRLQEEDKYLIECILYDVTDVVGAAEAALKKFRKVQLPSVKSNNPEGGVGPANPATTTADQIEEGNTKIIRPGFCWAEIGDSKKLVESSGGNVWTAEQEHSHSSYAKSQNTIESMNEDPVVQTPKATDVHMLSRVFDNQAVELNTHDVETCTRKQNLPSSAGSTLQETPIACRPIRPVRIEKRRLFDPIEKDSTKRSGGDNQTDSSHDQNDDKAEGSSIQSESRLPLCAKRMKSDSYKLNETAKPNKSKTMGVELAPTGCTEPIEGIPVDNVPNSPPIKETDCNATQNSSTPTFAPTFTKPPTPGRSSVSSTGRAAKKYFCEESSCDFQTMNLRNYKDHRMTARHSPTGQPIKPFQCDFTGHDGVKCEKLYKRNDGLKKHKIRDHKGL